MLIRYAQESVVCSNREGNHEEAIRATLYGLCTPVRICCADYA